MALINKTLCNTVIGINVLASRFSTSSTRHIDQKYRSKKGFTDNPNAYGPLTNWPDYSYKDGRPTPLGVRQLSRLNKQKHYAARIVKLVKEVDYAVERHKQLLKDKDAEKQKILDKKLLPKGNKLSLKKD